MALASEEEWKNDPELQAMRKEFVDSFAERRKALDVFLSQFRDSAEGDPAVLEALKSVAFVAHKLAGAGETYGFPTLTLASAAIEDWHELVREETLQRSSAVEDGLIFAHLLVELLEQAQVLGKDPGAMISDSRLKKLRAAARDLRRKD